MAYPGDSVEADEVADAVGGEVPVEGNRQCGTEDHGEQQSGEADRGHGAAGDAAAAQGIELSPRSPRAIRLWAKGRARALARQGDCAGTARAIGRALDLTTTASAPPAAVMARLRTLKG
ncbi:hypothetical protein RVR_1733 [Actinacidiphila reveromycinica]|uniref:Uncharacterized protein n=1 Tax=Actinacidiphila reveromycinica TaxID=659352 RepID=A0A7U3ULS9_9ACTN|nr:hypothetical protein [Streptomyces sp. SN-593]BBA96435.1 hypothetical protein RVR_1733 [Streptomyces sp. SN-593]